MPDHVVSVIARRKNNEFRFVAMWAQSLRRTRKGLQLVGKRRLIFPGGMEEAVDHGDKEKTLRAETYDETGLIIPSGVPIKLLHTVQKSKDHAQHFLHVWRRDCRGTLRTVPIEDGRTLLYIPFWATRKELEEHLHPTHREVLPYLPK